MTGQRARLRRRPVFVTYHLAPHATGPWRSVLSLPVFPYCGSDAVATHRIRQVLDRFGIDATPYCDAVRAIGPRAEPTVGFHSHVFFQREANGPRVTTHFCPLLYARRHGLLALDPPTDFWPHPTSPPPSHLTRS